MYFFLGTNNALLSSNRKSKFCLVQACGILIKWVTGEKSLYDQLKLNYTLTTFINRTTTQARKNPAWPAGSASLTLPVRNNWGIFFVPFLKKFGADRLPKPLLAPWYYFPAPFKDGTAHTLHKHQIKLGKDSIPHYRAAHKPSSGIWHRPRFR